MFPVNTRSLTLLCPAQGAAFYLLLWEWVITFDDEVNLIWTKPKSSWLKWLFLFSRYYIFGATIAARCVEAAIVYESRLNSPSLRVWFSCQALIGLHAMSPLEIILMTRVYALYGKPKWMQRFFIALFVTENILVIVGMFIHYPRTDFEPDTVLNKLSPSLLYFGSSTLFNQLILMYLTLRKYLDKTWNTVPIVQLMFRDGTFSFSILTLLTLVMSILTAKAKPTAVAAFSWLLTAISCLTCRLVINMQKLPQESAQQQHLENASTGTRFTTVNTSRNSLARSRPPTDMSGMYDETDMSRIGLALGGMMVLA